MIANGFGRKAVYYSMDKTSEEQIASIAGISATVTSAVAVANPVSASLPSAVKTPLYFSGSINPEDMQRRIRDLESTIYKMTSFIQEQQQELEARRWTVNDLQSRLQRNQSNDLLKQELDCAVAECHSLEQDLQPQKERLAKQQRILDEYYEKFMRNPCPPVATSNQNPELFTRN